MNVVVIRNPGRQMGLPRRDPYMMDVDKGRNCYNNFTVLSIEEYNKNYSDSSDIPVFLPCDN